MMTQMTDYSKGPMVDDTVKYDRTYIYIYIVRGIIITRHNIYTNIIINYI